MINKTKLSYKFIDQWIQFIKYNKKTDPTKEYKRSLLILGPSGIGKSKCLYEILLSYGYDVTEFNLLDFKNINKLKDVIHNILHYKNIQSLFTNTKNNKILIFNEIDKISNSERCIINILLKYIRSHTTFNTSYIPIIFMSNTYANYFKTICDVAMKFQFPLPSNNDIFLFSKDYIATNNICITDVQLSCIVKYLTPNYRLIRNNLDVVDFYIKKHKKFSLAKITTLLKNHTNDLDIDVFQSIYELLNTNNTLESCEHIMSKDTKYILLLLHKNYIPYLQYNTKDTFHNKLQYILDIHTYINYSSKILYKYEKSNNIFLYKYINSTVPILINSIIKNKKTQLEYGKYSLIKKSSIYSKLNYKFCNLKYIKIICNKFGININNYQLFAHYTYHLLKKYKTKKYNKIIREFLLKWSITHKELDKIYKLSYINKQTTDKINYNKIYKEIIKFKIVKKNI